MTHIEIPAPNEYLTFMRVIEGGRDITNTVSVEHLFTPRRVVIDSAIPITGIIEIA